MIKLLPLLFIIVLFSCNSKKREIQKIIQEWNQKTIIFPTLETKFMGKDTICNDLLKSKYKIVSYVDTSNCAPCSLRLYDWKIFMNEIHKKNQDVNFIFILHLKDYDEYVKLQIKNKFTNPVFYDPTNLFYKENKLPQNTIFHTFLIDDTNKVIAIGDPISNFEIRELYTQLIDSLKI